MMGVTVTSVVFLAFVIITVAKGVRIVAVEGSFIKVEEAK